MLIPLNRKALESPLINRSGPRGVMVGMPALRVRHGQQSHELAQLAIDAGPQDQMPMVGRGKGVITDIRKTIGIAQLIGDR